MFCALEEKDKFISDNILNLVGHMQYGMKDILYYRLRDTVMRIRSAVI